VLVGDYSANVVVVLLSIGLAKGLESISDILHGAMQQSERLDWVSHSLILRGVASVLVVGAAFVATGSLAWTMAALVLTRVAILFGYDLSSAAACLGSVPGESRYAQVAPRIDRKVIARLFWLSWPVGLTVTVLSLNTYVPRFFLAETHGDAALGIFGAFAYVIIVGQMVVAAIGAAASPRLAKHYDDGDLSAFFDLTWRMAALCGAAGLAIVIVSLAMGRQAVTWLYGPVYAVHADVFTWMMVAAGVGYVSAVFGYVVTSTRRFHSLTIPYALGALFTAALSVWLVPTYGIQGAAWVMLGVSLSNLAIGVILVLQAVREKRGETAGSSPARNMGS
jgi:O-antigen/teichoic acid export membrane protein